MGDQPIQAVPVQRRFPAGAVPVNRGTSSTLPCCIFWIVVFLCLLWVCIMTMQAGSFDKPKCPDFWCKLRVPGVELQLARKAPTFQQIIDQGDRKQNIQNIAVITRNTKMDFLFIVLYSSSLILFAFCQRHRLTPLVCIAISIAGLFDVFEDQRILNALTAIAAGQPLAHLPRPFSLVKWIAFAAALFLLAVLLWKAARRFWIPLLLMVAALMVLIGTIASFFTHDNFSQFISLALISLFFALLFTLVQYAPFTRPRFTLSTLLAFIEHAYLLRFQIIAAIVLVAALPIGYLLLPGVFRGVFDSGGWRSFVFIVWAAFQLAWTVMITSRLVLRYGPARFPLVPPITLREVSACTVVRFGLLAVPCVGFAFLGSLDLHIWEKIIAIVVGFLLSLALLVLTAALHFYVEAPGGATAEEIFPSFGFLKRVRKGGRSRFWIRIDRWLAALPATLTPGLLRAGRLRSGHQMAAIFLLMLLGIYVVLGFIFSPDLFKPEHLPAALFFLLFVIIILAWFFAGAAFMFDRFRLPVLTTVFALSLATGFIRTDHEFSLATLRSPRTALSSKDVLDDWVQGRGKNGKKTIVIVATAGGGIRAAAWTAEVLTRLQSECGGQDFSNSVVLISSVSGGSVGSMFFLRRFKTDDGSLPSGSLQEVVKDAERSSLSAVGWGLLYPDLLRTFPVLGMAVPQTFDRGWALENSWVSGWDNPPTLYQWRDAVAHGMLPAVIFNATAVESGQRFLVATTDVADRTTALRFAQEFPNQDIPVATAARLSATFTYVSPATRAKEGSEHARVHVVDGGYYDNSGVVSALEWLKEAGDQALANYKILFVIIDAGPRAAAPGHGWSWQRQLTAPLEAIANVRTSSQQFRADLELELLRALLGPQVLPPARFLYQSDKENPLNWHLNKDEIAEVEKAWDKKDIAANTKLVTDSLGCRPKPPASGH